MNSCSTVLDQINNVKTTDSVEIVKKVTSSFESETHNLITEYIFHETNNTS